MKVFKTGALFLLMSLLSACGRQLVEFPKADAGAALDADATNHDAANIDTAATDLANADVANADVANADVANADVANADVANADTAPDVANGDAAGSDGALPDAAGSDAAAMDAAAPDAGSPDAGSPDAADAGGNPDAGPPTVISTSPANLAVSVAITKTLTATFSEPMDPTTINTTTFTLRQGMVAVPGVVSYVAASTAGTFVPTNALALNTIYTATITTGVKNAGGTPMALAYTWTFTTSACGQAPVVLGAAANFVVLAGSTVTNTGATSVTGDLGVSPGTAVTGFGPGILVGTQHAGDPTAAQAIADLTTAYNDAAGRTLCPVTVAGNLGGMTLAPGLYKSTSSLEVSSGDLTLDAQGDAAAVFIFQMASTLTTTAGRQVVLAGGARSKNVFWQVGTSATLGSTTAFQGTVMADQAITLNTGATLNGRVLARIAAVALDSNTIVKPAP